MRKILWLVLLLILLSSPAIATTPQITLTPQQITLCNSNARLRAESITNTANTTLQNLSLSLEANSSASLWQGSTEVHRGDIQPGDTDLDISWELTCDESSPGTHRVKVRYSALIGGQQGQGYASGLDGSDASAEVTITPAPPKATNFSIQGISPEQGTGIPIFRSKDSTVTIRLATDEPAECRLGISDRPFSGLPSLMSAEPGGSAHSITLVFVEGLHQLYARCRDPSGNTMASSARLELIVDKTSPTITIKRPSSWEQATTVPIEVTTDEQAQCRHSFILQSHDGMTALAAAGLAHSASLDLEEGVYSLYISCKDGAGNLATKTTTVNVDVPPAATITLGGEGALRAGLYRVNLTASEPLIAAPTLTYTLSGVDGTRPVSLEGSGTAWAGNMLLENTGREHLGSFTFKGINRNGREGTDIVSGKLFIVDAKPPAAPTDIDAAVENDTLVVVWRHQDADVARFVVYGSTSPFVGYADFITSVPTRRYVQKLPAEGTVYFRVSAVDGTGNEGPLSKELTVKIAATDSGWTADAWMPDTAGTGSAGGTSSSSSSPSSAAAESATTLQSLRQEVPSLLLDVQASRDIFSSSAVEFPGLDTLGLEELLREAAWELSAMEDGLESPSATASPEQLRLYRLKLAKLRRTTPKAASVYDRLTIEQSIQPEDWYPLIRETVLSSSGSASAARVTAAAIGLAEDSPEGQELFEKRYLAAISSLEGKLRVSRTSEVFDIEYLDGSTESRTLLVDEITGIELLPDEQGKGKGALPEGLSPEIIVYLPKSVAGDAGEIDILTEGYEVLEDDPLIAFPLTARRIEMILPGRLSESKVRQIQTFAAYEPEKFSRAVADSANPWQSSEGLLTRLLRTLRKEGASGQGGQGAGIEQIGLLFGCALILGMLGYYVYLRRGGVLLKVPLGSVIARHRRQYGAGEADLDPRIAAMSSKEQIEHSLRELERLSGEFDEEVQQSGGTLGDDGRDGDYGEEGEDNAAGELRRLQDFETVRDIIAEAEAAKASDDYHTALMLYKKLIQCYSGIRPEYKERVAGGCMALHDWLKQSMMEKR